jgi:hypothetical protein
MCSAKCDVSIAGQPIFWSEAFRDHIPAGRWTRAIRQAQIIKSPGRV